MTPGSRRHLLLVLTLALSGTCTSAKLVSSGRSERPAGSDPFHVLLVTADAAYWSIILRITCQAASWQSVHDEP
jgi:hypothetical protein